MSAVPAARVAKKAPREAIVDAGVRRIFGSVGEKSGARGVASANAGAGGGGGGAFFT
jgi:hypothetical protein